MNCVYLFTLIHSVKSGSALPTIGSSPSFSKTPSASVLSSNYNQHFGHWWDRGWRQNEIHDYHYLRVLPEDTLLLSEWEHMQEKHGSGQYWSLMTTVYGLHRAGKTSKITCSHSLKLGTGKPCFFDRSSPPVPYSREKHTPGFKAHCPSKLRAPTPVYTSHCNTELLPPCLCPTLIPQTFYTVKVLLALQRKVFTFILIIISLILF